MVWLIGNKGMLGTEVSRLLDDNNLSHIDSDRDVDITNRDSLLEFGRGKDICWIINCSAYTAVDRAEEEKDMAYLINETGVANVAFVAGKLGVKVIHLSTDYVFDGTKDSPLLEDDQVGPVSEYGRSKLAGERALLKIHPESFIIRTAWLYGKYGNNFVYTMLKLMNSRDSIKVVSDQRGTPTWTYDLASLLVEIISSNSGEYGIYHFSGEGDISWYDFACEIYRLGKERGLVESDCLINPCDSGEYPTAATRPAFSLLSKEKVKNTFNRKIENWKDSLNAFFERGVEL